MANSLPQEQDIVPDLDHACPVKLPGLPQKKGRFWLDDSEVPG